MTHPARPRARRRAEMATTKAKRKAIPTTTATRAAGTGPAWEEMTVEEFLGLDAVDAQVVEFRLGVAREARRLREAARVSQRRLAGRLGVSQPRLPAIERAEPGT